MSNSSDSTSKYNLRSKPSDSLKKNKDDDDEFPEDVEQLTPEEYKKLLAKLFPSKYMNEQIKNDIDEQSNEDSDDDEDYCECEEEDDDEDESSEEEDSSDEEDSSEDDSSEDEEDKDKINIILTIGGVNDKEESDDDSDSDSDSDSDDEEEEEEEEEETYEDWSKKELRDEIKYRQLKCKNKNSKKAMIKVLEENDNLPYEEWTKEELKEELKARSIKFNKKIKEKDMVQLLEKDDREEAVKNVNKMFCKKDKETKTKTKKSKDTEEESAANTLIDMKNGPQEKLSDTHVLSQFKDLAQKLSNKDQKNKLLGKAKTHIEEMEREVNKERKRQEKKEKDKNCKKFKKMMKGKNRMDDKKYFEKLELNQQQQIIKEFEKINDNYNQAIPYRFQVLESNILPMHKSAAMKKINSLRYMTPGEGEYYKLKYWVDGFMRIPFNQTMDLPLVIEDGIEKTHEFMFQAKKILDEAVFGLDDAKMQIMQMIGQLITNPKSVGTAIAIKGPMGTGKTTLVREGISKILQRPFAFIALGGATDSSFLEGHSYTYEGSSWGKIVDILMQSKCMNPVFFFDELDKVSDTPKGEEIIGILTHLTDTSQNSQFHDKYFSELDFDLSKALFIFSYNDESRVNPILKDRMYRIQTQGYETKDKQIITKDYVEPKICENVKMKSGDVIIDNTVLKHIIEKYTDGEKGVRNLKRCIEIIYTKLNLYRLMKPESQLFKEEKSLDVTFPYTVTTEIVDKLIKTVDKGEQTYLNFYL